MEVDYANAAAELTPEWGLETVRIYIPSPAGRAPRSWTPAGASRTTNSSCITTIIYYDHLGSIQAITHIAADPNEVNGGWDNVGNRMVYSYDA
ncbi:MAG: hypothetical protein E1N59_1110 [Puniceicoccaceae bacterium 5H]|nr:MAG: hypothetical protein E1N59_1110 [Puniceicoccaceae bacterium 5H]